MEQVVLGVVRVAMRMGLVVVAARMGLAVAGLEVSFDFKNFGFCPCIYFYFGIKLL